MKFTPGKSGNPSGRPVGAQAMRDLARQHSAESIQRLVEWMRSDNPKASVAASKEIMDRAWGKPMQPNEHTGPDGMAIPLEITVKFSRPAP